MAGKLANHCFWGQAGRNVLRASVRRLAVCQRVVGAQRVIVWAVVSWRMIMMIVVVVVIVVI